MIDTNIPRPDPAWDYYQTWRSLHEIKARIDEALEFMNDIESSTLQADEAIRSLLNPASNRLILIVAELSDNDEPPDES
ncbi:MAG: hypothetical protein V7K15_05490 [Nostoc sp.]